LYAGADNWEGFKRKGEAKRANSKLVAGAMSVPVYCWEETYAVSVGRRINI